MPHIEAIGSHPSEFFTHLKEANYTHAVHNTYSEFHLNPDTPPVALAIYGGDVALESTEAVLNILKSNIILLFFSPSLELRQVLQSATKTTIDLSQIELEDGVPLIVFKYRDADRYGYVPGFLKLDTSTTQARSPSESLQYAVKLIAQCESLASDSPAHREPRDVGVTSLDPPFDTCFFKPDSVLVTGSKTENGVTYTISWQIDVYAYGANLPPTNGTVYVVLKYGGQLTASAPWKRKLNDYTIGYYKVSDGNKLLQNHFQSPTSGVPQGGGTTIYDVALDQRLQLFRGADCNTPFDQPLSYTDRYSRTSYVVQISSLPNANEHRFDLREVLPFTDGSHAKPLADTNYVTRGVVMFRANQPKGSCRLDFEASIGPAKGNKQLTIDLKFGK